MCLFFVFFSFAFACGRPFSVTFAQLRYKVSRLRYASIIPCEWSWLVAFVFYMRLWLDVVSFLGHWGRVCQKVYMRMYSSKMDTFVWANVLLCTFPIAFRACCRSIPPSVYPTICGVAVWLCLPACLLFFQAFHIYLNKSYPFQVFLFIFVLFCTWFSANCCCCYCSCSTTCSRILQVVLRTI